MFFRAITEISSLIFTIFSDNLKITEIHSSNYFIAQFNLPPPLLRYGTPKCCGGLNFVTPKIMVINLETVKLIKGKEIKADTIFKGAI